MKTAKPCAHWWERRSAGNRHVNASGRCARNTAHPSGYCKDHRWDYRWTEEQEAAHQKTLAKPSSGGVALSVPMNPEDSSRAVLTLQWSCVCRRCDHRWLSRCSCASPKKHASGEPAAEDLARHREGDACQPPRFCPGCKMAYWYRPTGEVPRGRPAATLEPSPRRSR